MMDSSQLALAIWSYGISAAGFLAFAVQLAIGWRGNPRGALVLSAIGFSALWSGCIAGFALTGAPALWVVSYLLDALRFGAWFAFVTYLLTVPNPEPQGVRGVSGRRIGFVVALFVAGYFAAQMAFIGLGARLGTTDRLAHILPLAAAIIGLVMTEQLYRNLALSARWAFKPLCLGLAGVFLFDLYLFADAFLFRRIDPDVWIARGIAHAFVIPFVAVSAARNRDWSFNIAVSRHVVFHSTALLVSGVYLLTVAAAGYYLRFFGGSWGRALQTTFLFAALLALAAVLLSGSLRAKLRVLLNKHFFSYRYDYRQEWLRFTQALSHHDSTSNIRELAIKALADLVESPAGLLFLLDNSGSYREVASINVPATGAVESATSSLPTFLGRTGWVIDLDDLRSDPMKYEGLTIPSWMEDLGAGKLVVPLTSNATLLGFVVLMQPRTKLDINWEVSDLLKTAGKQAATFLGQIQATEALLESRKFDSFNRMSAFVVHDIKNLVAQLSLLLKNAERHHDNPEFRQDMLMTIGNVVDRMKNLLMQLRDGTKPIEKPGPVALADIIKRILAAKGAQPPGVKIELAGDLRALGHAERLERVIGHLVQNALDATDKNGKVWMRLWRDGDNAIIEVGDTGTGMTEEFVRDKLFKPFQSTKISGMGIGAYESAQYVSELGGKISVESKSGHGTQVRVQLPIAQTREDREIDRREVA